MSENQPSIASNESKASGRSTSPQAGIRKSTRLVGKSLSSTTDQSQAILHAQQDSAASTSACTSTSPAENLADPNSTKETAASSSKLRNWVPWDLETENLFYEALKLHGKDFDAITKYITQKSKSSSKGKSSRRVRDYYRNTVTKILRSLDLSEINVSNDVKELFTLVGYGELKKRTVNLKWSVKTTRALSSLVLNGWTPVKVPKKKAGKFGSKNKLCTKIIRMPVCPALRKFVDGKDHEPTDTNIPKTVAVELLPNSQRDRIYVLGCWQNPFIRFELNPNQPVRQVLHWLEQKWIPQDMKLRKAVLGEDITNELPDITIYPSSEVTLHMATVNAVCTKSAAISAASSSGAAFGGTYQAINLGLRHCFTSSSCSPERQPPASPGKGDRKRRKSASAVSDSEQQLSPLETASAENAKRFRRDLSSPTSDEKEGFMDGESSCDACPVPANSAETDDEKDAVHFEEDMVMSTVQDGGSHAVCRKSGNEKPINQQQHHQQQPSSSVTLNPEQLVQGINLNNCGVLTVGQLYLMCGKISAIRFKYNITPKATNLLVDPHDSWQFFIGLVRSEFLDTLNKKQKAPAASHRSKSHSTAPADVEYIATVPAATVTNTASISSDSSTVTAANANIMSTTPPMQEVIFVDPEIQQQLLPPPSHQTSLENSVFVVPGLVFSIADAPRESKHQSNVGKPTSVAKPTAGVNNNDAFLKQIQELTAKKKKPMVVNVRRPGANRGEKLPVATIPAAAHNQATRSDRSRRNAASSTTTTERPAAATTTPTSYQVIPSNNSSVSRSSSYEYPRSQAESHTIRSIDQHSNLTTPDVSLLCSTVVTTASNTNVAVQAVHDVPSAVQTSTSNQTGIRQELITSDSFLDFSMGSFPYFTSDPPRSPKITANRDPVSNVVRALRMDADDSALSSPPRLIRSTANDVGQTSSSGMDFNKRLSVDNDLTNSSLFRLLESVDDSSAARNFFESCATPSVLETPEKCKGDDA